MSALTKVFVVLHVILSMMLVAAMVTFVNKQEDFKANAAKADDRRKVAEAQRDDALTQASAARGERDLAVAEAQGRTTALTQANAQLAADVQRLQGDVQQRDLQVQQAQVQVQTALGAQKAAQEGQHAAEVALQDVRKQADDLQKKYSESMVAISDLTNKTDVTTRRLQKAIEDIAARDETIESLRRNGPKQVFVPGPGEAPAVQAVANNLRGVVRSKKNIQGVEYATISLGTADNVQKGMQFRVVDRQGNQFLGYLVVDSVDANEATGHLTGPKVGQVRAGNDVFTQWQ